MATLSLDDDGAVSLGCYSGGEEGVRHFGLFVLLGDGSFYYGEQLGIIVLVDCARIAGRK